MANDIDKLLNLKNKIESAKEAKLKAEGRLDELLNQLKKEHNCSDLSEIDSTIEVLEKEIRKIEKQFDDGINKLKEQYSDW